MSAEFRHGVLQLFSRRRGKYRPIGGLSSANVVVKKGVRTGHAMMTSSNVSAKSRGDTNKVVTATSKVAVKSWQTVPAKPPTTMVNNVDNMPPKLTIVAGHGVGHKHHQQRFL